MNQNISNFLLCGSAGWCMEIFWTGLHSLFTGQKTLTGKTSLLMFPIYGCAAVIAPLSVKLSSFPFFYRGILYTAGHYGTEYIFMKAMRKILEEKYPSLQITCAKVKSPYMIL